MSLVNKMLRDLDARRAGDSERATFPAAVTPLAAHQEPRRGVPRLWLGMVLVAAGLGAAAWYGAQQMPATPSVAGTPPAPPVPVPAPASSVTPSVTSAAEPARAAAVALPSLRLADELSVVPAPLPAPQRKAVAPAPKAPERLTDPVPPRPPVVALPKVPTVPTVPAEGRVEKQVRLPSAAERAESEYRRGVLAQRQGRIDDAAGSYLAALEQQPEHAAARQTLAALLIETKRFDEAEELLRKGTELAPVRLASTLALARLKVERNGAQAALELLLKNSAAGESSPEYQGFAGALLNRAGRAAEAVERYQAATRLAPNEGRWWAGLGIALDAAGKSAEAREAYQKARSLPGLPADLAHHVEQRLR
ncbi:MAG: tetratricopeptide repeat protein [Sulfuritalea sp.]